MMRKYIDEIDVLIRDKFPGCTGISISENPDDGTETTTFHGLNKTKSNSAKSMVVDRLLDLVRSGCMREIRNERDQKLQGSDWKATRTLEQTVRGSTLDNTFLQYRQDLRDLPAGIDLSNLASVTEIEAFEPVWPEAP